MAVLISTLQLLFLGALISPVYLLDACELIQNTTHLGSFNLSVIPDDYKADTNYSVTISGATNSSSVILQAIDSQNSSVGQWENPVVNCSNGLSGQQNITNTATIQWKSPNNVTDRVEIRVFVTFSDGSTLLQKTTLSRASSVTPASTTRILTTRILTTSSVSTVQASSFLLAAVHLLSIFVTGKLLS
ncbi:placenta-expressed transcript 1 protein [Chelonia mydas]|uniref:placenta-expressed transcript 1 protein n=1 Tax=Chelonia mydas TaxID=8469 RepID=UPI0018A217CE|nr:placenta-expressed transcript 1 protein [Chelonia mydas]XP_043390078.1 placenta-expressed transcript 1 protein [Chelonia mydas]